jgi:hypothetical protein
MLAALGDPGNNCAVLLSWYGGGTMFGIDSTVVLGRNHSVVCYEVADRQLHDALFYVWLLPCFVCVLFAFVVGCAEDMLDLTGLLPRLQSL